VLQTRHEENRASENAGHDSRAGIQMKNARALAVLMVYNGSRHTCSRKK
jgi:hypothetical protein